MAMTLLLSMTVCAADLEQVEENMVLETIEETALLEKAESTAAEVYRVAGGTTVIVLEAEKDGWCKVSGQGQEGYVKVSALKTVGDKEALDKEFDEVKDTVCLIFDEVIARESEMKQARIWGTIIVVLVVAIFGVGIASALKKNKLENESEQS